MNFLSTSMAGVILLALESSMMSQDSSFSSMTSILLDNDEGDFELPDAEGVVVSVRVVGGTRTVLEATTVASRSLLEAAATLMTLFRVPISLLLVLLGCPSSWTQFPSTTNLNSYSPGGKSSLRAHLSVPKVFAISTGSHFVKDPASWTFSTAPLFHSNTTAVIFCHSKLDN